MELLKTTSILIFVVSQLSYVLTLKDDETNTNTDSETDKSTICTSEKCIMKCCPLGKYVTVVERNDNSRDRVCIHFHNTTRDLDSAAKDIFYQYPDISKLNLKVKAGIFETNETFKMMSASVTGLFNVYLTENVEVYLELPNTFNRLTIPNNRFCWDHKVETSRTGLNQTGITKNETEVKPSIWVIMPENPAGPSRTSTALFTTGMLVTCFFLLVVLVVYALLPELRNLCGQILMAYMASQLVAFLLLATMRIGIELYEEPICRILTYLVYFWFLASFCWLHVMSYDIWSTFRGYAKARSIHRGGERFKLLLYCLYAFGVPLAMTIGFIIVNEIDMSHVPWFITPNVPRNGCFMEGSEKFLYLYVPMLILILCNWMFYLMTAFNVWRLSRGTAVLDTAAAGTPQAHRTQRNRFMVYLKLSAVMGLNWVMEAASLFFPDYSVWFISDFYNILIGVTIFLIFVCKRKILEKLKKKFLKWRSERRHCQNKAQSTLSISVSSASQETQTLQMSSDPKGPGYNTEDK